MLVEATTRPQTFRIECPGPEVDPQTDKWYGKMSVLSLDLVVITMSGEDLPATSKAPMAPVGMDDQPIDSPAFVILAHELGEGFVFLDHWEEYVGMDPAEVLVLNHSRAIKWYENEVRKDVGLPLRKYEYKPE